MPDYIPVSHALKIASRFGLVGYFTVELPVIIPMRIDDHIDWNSMWNVVADALEESASALGIKIVGMSDTIEYSILHEAGVTSKGSIIYNLFHEGMMPVRVVAKVEVA